MKAAHCVKDIGLDFFSELLVQSMELLNDLVIYAVEGFQSQ